MDLYLSVHHHREFIVRRRKPVRAAFGAQDLDHVLHIFRHGYFFIRLCASGHFKDIGKGIMPSLVINNFDSAFLVPCASEPNTVVYSDIPIPPSIDIYPLSAALCYRNHARDFANRNISGAATQAAGRRNPQSVCGDDI